MSLIVKGYISPTFRKAEKPICYVHIHKDTQKLQEGGAGDGKNSH